MTSCESLPERICKVVERNGWYPQEFEEEYPAGSEGNIWRVRVGGPDGVSSSISLLGKIDGVEISLATLRMDTGPSPGLRLWVQRLIFRARGGKGSWWLVQFYYNEKGTLQGPVGLSFRVKKEEFPEESWRLLGRNLPAKIDFLATLENLFSACKKRESPSRTDLLVLPKKS